MKVYSEETFGPLFTIITFTDIKDAHKRIENREHIGKVILVP